MTTEVVIEEMTEITGMMTDDVVKVITKAMVVVTMVTDELLSRETYRNHLVVMWCILKVAVYCKTVVK